MGAYVWGLCPPSTVVEADLNGEKVTLGRIRYLYKPGWRSISIRDRLASRYISPIENSWKNRTMPMYVAVGERHRYIGGETILKWQQGRVAVVDDPNWSGLEYVGDLKITLNGRKRIFTILSTQLVGTA